MTGTKLLAGVTIVFVLTGLAALAEEAPLPADDALYAGFAAADHARWGEVPLWWWEGQRMTSERATAELEELAAKGVKAVCPIQRSPGRCDPPSFSPEWWDLFAHVNKECQRLGMALWAYDQVGYGNYGWLEKAAAEVQDPDTERVVVVQADGPAGAPIRLALPAGEVIALRAYPLIDGVADDGGSIELPAPAQDGVFEWTPPGGAWRVAALVGVPYPSFYLSAAAADRFIEQFYGKIESTLGAAAMGTSFVGVFQDEHPPTPRDLYTAALSRHFEERFGYAIGRAIPALHFDVGPMTPKYRVDFFDAYLDVVEPAYWKRVYDWTRERGLLTSHDNWGRNNIYQQSEGYIDYFRTQRWFSAPGYDDAGRHPLTERNYYDAKVAASIARLYRRPRVWNEAFHTSGWGRTTDETVTWLSADMAFGANLYDEHGLYYATNASTWEHAAPDPHWRQPYWRYYNVLSDFVARSSYLMSQGTHVVDAAVHYPVASLLAGETPGIEDPDYNGYMALSRTIFNAGIDNDIIDDDSILGASIENGQLIAGGNGYRTLVFGPETTVRRGVLKKAFALAESGGTVLFFERLPEATVEGGRNDTQLGAFFEQMLGGAPSGTPGAPLQKEFSGGGYAAYVPADAAALPRIISEHIERDFIPEAANCYATHRRSGDTDIYLVQNAVPGEDVTLRAQFHSYGIPEIWDAFTGAVHPVDVYRRAGVYVQVEHEILGNAATFIVFRPGSGDRGGVAAAPSHKALPLGDTWEFSVDPTRNNRWGEFRWPPSRELIGPEVRNFRYQLEGGDAPAWHAAEFDDSTWGSVLYSTGPYWITLPVAAGDSEAAPALLGQLADLAPGASTGGNVWQEVGFSKTIGLAEAAPWGGHSGYPDGHIDRNFIKLPEGRNLLFTRIRSPKAQRRGLRVELFNSLPRLWVNGVQQPFEDAVGNLPLEAGVNTVLLDVPDGGHGRLYVQADAPGVATMAEAAAGMVRPAIEKAAWIWEGDTQSTYVRTSFDLDRAPAQARLTVSAYSGYQLYVNGEKLAEEIGPWSNWRKPETLTVTPYLRPGKNTIAIWGQLFAGQNVNKGPEAFESRGIVAAMNLRFDDGSEWGLATGGSWKGAARDFSGWESPNFDDSAWDAAAVRGHMGDAPWGMEVVENVGIVTETERPLSIDLESPYLTCFEEVPDIAYDVLPVEHPRAGWFRFVAPPGLQTLALPADINVQAWVNGEAVEVHGGVVTVPRPPEVVSRVALRVEMKPGAYAGAVFPEPIRLQLAGGEIKPGLWADYALPTYSGIGVYAQEFTVDPSDAGNPLILNLGQVLVAAEVFVNGKSVGVRIARPFQFDLSDATVAGENRLEVHVANTIAPHYSTIPSLAQGPTESGLLGPVQLYSVSAAE